MHYGQGRNCTQRDKRNDQRGTDVNTKHHDDTIARVMNAKGVTEYDPLPPMDALQARVESPGEAVEPASLYRAQRELLQETRE